jgi:pimeloyl-ACP methyl ester carboxylesterase
MEDFPTASTTVRGVKQVFTHLNPGGRGPLLLVHGWPETRRIWWRMLQPLTALGYEVICPDLRGFGDSEVSPDGVHDVPVHSRDMYALCREHLGHESVITVGGDLGGPVIQDLALRFPRFVEKMVLFNSPLPFDKERMAGMRTRPAGEASDYFIRQGTDPDGLAAELATADARRRYIATFYTSRFWAHPGAFTPDEVAFHTEPFADATKLRASFGGYESVFDETKRSEPPVMTRNDVTPTMILFGPSDHVIYPEYDRMAAVVFATHVGPFLLRDCGHFVQWEAADVLVSAISAWVS